jgi:hypothetical protein
MLAIQQELYFYFIDITYSLRLIILFTNIDVSRHILVIDTSVLTKSNMGQRKYNIELILYGIPTLI